MAMNPLHQFVIEPITPLHIAGFDVSFTNHSLWLMITVAAVLFIFGVGAAQGKKVPGRWQALVEMTFEFILKLVTDICGQKGAKFAPLIFSVFLFVALANLLGMIPHSYTATSQIGSTAVLSLMVFATVIGTGLYVHGLKFFGLFFPHGTPLYMAPLIVPLEIISFLARPCTLAIRLAANMVAGHIILKLFATFVIMLGSLFTAAFIAPFIFLFAFTALEVFVALLQAFIFTVLTCVYLNDAINLHH